jgi:hypothetical protein
MQQFLDSGDPILIAEAMAWAQINPGVLQITQLQRSLMAGSQPRQLGDLSTILVEIETRLQVLGWSDERVSHDLQQRFGKRSLAMLSDSQLRHWLEQLSHTASVELPQPSDE